MHGTDLSGRFVAMDETVLHYRILEKIGEGGMGVVYKALDTRLDRPVAIKTLPAINDPNRSRQFMWEARAAAGLRHPSIVVVHDIVSDRGMDFIVMEYIPGGPLSAALGVGRLPTGRVLHYAREIASALEAAHAAGIIHRDLKPSNILVTPEGSIKLVDFGLARLHQAEMESHAEAPLAAGTCGYMSPEQARGQPATPQSDIFSFGAVVYEMVTGKRAFDGNSATAVMAAVFRDEPPAVRSLARDCPPTLGRIVEQCLRKDPRRRFQHMGDVRLALEEVTLPGRAARRVLAAGSRAALVSASLVPLLVLTAWFLYSRYSEPIVNSTPIPLTSDPGIETAAAWSPDGSRVAFNWDGEQGDNQDIYVVQPGSSERLRLTTDPGIDDRPAWSPDGRWIAYTHIAKDGSRYSVNLVSPLGGSPRTVLTSANPLNVSNWTPNGRAVLVDMATAPHQPRAVWAIFLGTPPSAGSYHGRPQVSLGTWRLPYRQTVRHWPSVRKTAWRTAELYLQDLTPELSPAGTARRVTDLGYVARPAWTPDGGRIVFEAHRDGVGIWQVDRTGKHVRPVFGAPDSASLPALGKRPGGQTSLAFTNTLGRSSIWRYSTAGGPGGAAVELAASSRSETNPRFSDDGKRLVFSSTRSGYHEIWVANADGSQPLQLTDLHHQLSEAGHWSPDGDRIAFVSQDRGARQIYWVGSTGGPAVPMTQEAGVENGSGWTRDASGYYYDSLRSGHREVWKAPRRGGGSERMTAGAAHGGFESRRGIFFYWREDSGQTVTLMRRTPNGDVEVALSPKACALCGTAPSAEGFYYVAADTNDVYRWAESTGRTVRVFKPPRNRFMQFTVSPDGRWLAYGFAGPPSVDLMIMEDFH